MADAIITLRTCRKCSAPIAGPNCLVCARARAAKWRAAHPERVKAACARWAAANPEKKKQWHDSHREQAKLSYKKWIEANLQEKKSKDAKRHAANREVGNQRKAKWRKEHPDIVRIHSHNRRARQAKNSGSLSAGLAAKLFKLQKGKCPCCGKPLGKDFHLDHKVPVKSGGVNEDWNMQLLRKICNLKKGIKDPVQFMQERGFLL